MIASEENKSLHLHIHVGLSRDEVLEKVMLVFWEKGYNDTSLEDLLSVTGLSKSSLYQAFGNKHELFLTAYITEM